MEKMKNGTAFDTERTETTESTEITEKSKIFPFFSRRAHHAHCV
jgi:hypothetical protein